jgi:hypothetical protein
MFDQGLTVALWSPRHTHRLLPVDDMIGWSLDACAKAEIYRILRETVTRSGRSGIYAPSVTQRDGLWPRTEEQLLINDSLDPLVESPRPHGRLVRI